MNSVLRRSLRQSNLSVLQRQNRTSRPFYHIPSLHICGHTGWRQYSTHNPDRFKDKSAVGVSRPHDPPPFAALLNAFPGYRSLLLRRRLFSFWPVLASIFTLDWRSKGCRNKSVSLWHLLPFGYVYKFWIRERDGVALRRSCPRRWPI